MKRNYLYIFNHWAPRFMLVALIGWGAVGCEKQDLDRTFEGPYFVRFTDTTVTYKESYSKPINIQVHNVGPQLDQPITITYTVTGTARAGKDYTIQGTEGSVTIPAKASTGNIVVKLINNANNILESSSLIFTLTGVQPSTLQVGFGKDNIVGKQLKLTIQDDCLLGGFYTGSAKLGSSTYSVPNIEITSSDCKTYTVSNWNIGFFNFDATHPQLTFVDNGDNSLTIPSQTNPNLGSTDKIEGSGAWNPRDRKITLNLQLTLRLSNGKDTTLIYPQTYTPQ